MAENRKPALVEPTANEKRNGWTAEALAAYHVDRDRAVNAKVLDRPKQRPSKANSRYDPIWWRK